MTDIIIIAIIMIIIGSASIYVYKAKKKIIIYRFFKDANCKIKLEK